MLQMQSQQAAVNNGRWTKNQHKLFLQGIRLHGKNWKNIEPLIKTRTGSQIRSHAQKYFNKLDRRRQDPRYGCELQSFTNLNDQNLMLKGVKSKHDAESESQFTVSQNQKHPEQTQLHTMENQKKAKRFQEKSFYMQAISAYPMQTILKDFFKTFIDIPKTENQEKASNKMKLRSYFKDK